ncbi:STAS domain-containing protein [Actinacidiphila oryziradicis]|uniref:Anti-sigma factor antagonist n=1 Tax=Actinacidiphila oryziradicis TaxID=2571141 RepID=A0A4U0RVM9_9ACTN|nr:STAS domain-containing protein [Actinacidiphila oryziradicis]
MTTEVRVPATSDGLTAHRTAGRPACRDTVVELHGEIDILTAPSVTARLDALTSAGQPHLVVDLRSVTFMDCSGLATLCRARRRALNLGGRLGLVVDDLRLLRLLRLTRLSEAFEVYDNFPGLPVMTVTEPPPGLDIGVPA